jgi:hypothetical protein
LLPVAHWRTWSAKQLPMVMALCVQKMGAW